ncbi:MAG: hypothetical protein HDT48_08140 [Ruminococcaceae bacterium]|nr:hypothetical protein [Oscillospiraceae bacterium]
MKTIKLIPLICAFFLLCSCANNSIESPESTTTASESEEKNVNEETVMRITGSPLTEDMLADFEYEINEEKLDKNEKELKGSLSDEEWELYLHACGLIRITSTENIVWREVFNERERAAIEYPDNSPAGYSTRYIESGFTYDSFYKAITDVFTVSAAGRYFAAYPWFTDYNGELFFQSLSKGGDMSLVHQEFEVINRSDDELVIRCTEYHVISREKQGGEYNPDKKDEYLMEQYCCIFVDTENGWRIDQFYDYF